MAEHSPPQRPQEVAAQAEQGAESAQREFAPHPPFRQAYAAIDLGTNNCRLLIAGRRARISW